MVFGNLRRSPAISISRREIRGAITKLPSTLSTGSFFSRLCITLFTDPLLQSLFSCSNLPYRTSLAPTTSSFKIRRSRVPSGRKAAKAKLSQETLPSRIGTVSHPFAINGIPISFYVCWCVQNWTTVSETIRLFWFQKLKSSDGFPQISWFVDNLNNLCFFQAVLWFLARWSSTYLMPPEESGKEKGSYENYNNNQLLSKTSTNALLSFFGENNQGKVVLDIIIRISLTALNSYSGERELQV
ncbi:hypothetical protein CDL12_02877 [Handroanthus impetiginosus]|uniref:Uncharacterized protein n=1 Tax=Handroanthus impetiginosus TaxID=429701 RepID=A0A2G9I3K1_9LAMI|nr:hypothetical protein CDL12_02877 [Handroanthus impetiginosus]